MKFLTKENITLLLAVLGSLGTLISWIYIYICNKKSVKIHLLLYKKGELGCLCYMSFENLSRLPISITRIQIEENENYYDCQMIPDIALTSSRSQNGEIYHRKVDYTEQIPINIAPLSSRSGYVYFPLHKFSCENPPIPLSFQVNTNRGSLKKISLEPLQLYTD